MFHMSTIDHSQNSLAQKLLKKLDNCSKEKMQRARACHQRYENCRKAHTKLRHEDITSFIAKFFEHLN